MRITDTFVVAASPETVFDYMTNPSNLAQWQTSKTSVEQLTDGPPGLGTRVRERTKPPGGREFEQVVEFTTATCSATSPQAEVALSRWRSGRSGTS